MTFEQFVTYIIAPVLAAVGAIFGIVKILIPRLVEARLDYQKDEQEHRQRRDELETSYHLSVGSEAHRMMGDLLATSQDNEKANNNFIRQDIKGDLETIGNTLGNLAIAVSKLIETEENRAKLFTLQNGILSDMSHDLRSQQAKITSLIELIKTDE